MSIDRRVIAGALGVVLLLGGVLFLAGIGVGRALAPLVPGEAEPVPPAALASAPKPAPAAPAVVGQPVAAASATPRTSELEDRPEPTRSPAPLQAEVVAPAVAAPAPSPAAPAPLRILRQAPREGYGLQLGAFETEAQAEAFVAENREVLAPLAIHILASEIPKKGTWYRVRVGLYAEKATAQRALKKLGSALEQSAIVVSYR